MGSLIVTKDFILTRNSATKNAPYHNHIQMNSIYENKKKETNYSMNNNENLESELQLANKIKIKVNMGLN